MRRAVLLALLAACATSERLPPRPAPLPVPAPTPAARPAVPPPGPGGSREVMAVGPEARGKPVLLGLAGGGPPRAVVAFDSLAVQVLPVPAAAGEGQPIAVPVESKQLTAERLLSSASSTRLVLALGLADDARETRLLSPGAPRRIPDTRPCAVAAGEASSIAVVEKMPRPGSSSADLLLVPEGGAPVPLGAHAAGDLCGAAPRGDGFFVAFSDAKGRLLVRPVDAKGRSAGATVALPLPAGERLVSPALTAVSGGALLVATSRRDGAVRGFVLDPRGRAQGDLLTIAPPDNGSETGGAAVAPIPGGGFAVAWHAARLGADGSPTALRLAWLDAAEKPVGNPIDLMGPLALAPGPAALAGTGDGAVAGGVVMREGSQMARVVLVPPPGRPKAPEVTPPPLPSP